jgi:hypothetical protein
MFASLVRFILPATFSLAGHSTSGRNLLSANLLRNYAAYKKALQKKRIRADFKSVNPHKPVAYEKGVLRRAELTDVNPYAVIASQLVAKGQRRHYIHSDRDEEVLRRVKEYINVLRGQLEPVCLH